MTLRSGHGTGRGVPRIEVLPADELPSATPTEADGSNRTAHGYFGPGNSAGKKRVRPGSRGALGLDKSDPRWRPFQTWGRRYAKHRRTELARAHGGSISAGVGALVESAAVALAASRFLYALAAELADPELFKRASALANDARQNELAAWELAAREATARPKSNRVAELRKQFAKGNT